MAWALATESIDRADFLDRESVSAVPLARGTVNLDSGTSAGILDVRRWQFLQIFGQMDVVGRTMIVQAVWSEDAAGAFTTGLTHWTCQPGAEIVDSMPNQGPYVEVFVSFVPPLNTACYVSILGRNTPGISGVGTALGGNLTQQIAVASYGAIGAGATVQGTTNFVQHGWATLVLNSDTAAVVAQVQPLTVSGALSGNVIATVQSAAGNYLRRMAIFAVPTEQIHLTVVNLNGFGVAAGAVVQMGPSPH